MSSILLYKCYKLMIISKKNTEKAKLLRANKLSAQAMQNTISSQILKKQSLL